jgi:hypothetical protein
MEILLYGLAQEDKEDYKEQLLATNCKNQDDINKVIKHATQYGFHGFRVAYYNGEKPNFINALNI